MTFQREYDFLTWTSFPSSAKMFNDTLDWAWGFPAFNPRLGVVPGKSLTVRCKAKQINGVVRERPSVLAVHDVVTELAVADIVLPLGTFDWQQLEKKVTVPPETRTIRLGLGVGAATPNAPVTVWYDDIEVYQDDVLIYSNDFSNWDPMIGAGVGAPIGGVAGYLLKEPLGPIVSEAVGAVLGGALGGGVGLLTGLGIIPVPQIPIPALGAAPEGSVAPARLGKYQITG